MLRRLSLCKTLAVRMIQIRFVRLRKVIIRRVWGCRQLIAYCSVAEKSPSNREPSPGRAANKCDIASRWRPVSIASASRVRTRNCILLRLRRCSDHLFGSSAIALSFHAGCDHRQDTEEPTIALV
jgi:hypothetical protein